MLKLLRKIEMSATSIKRLRVSKSGEKTFIPSINYEQMSIKRRETSARQKSSHHATVISRNVFQSTAT